MTTDLSKVDEVTAGTPFFPPEIFTVGGDAIVQGFRELDILDPDPKSKKSSASVGQVPFTSICLAVRSFDCFFQSDRDSMVFLEEQLKKAVGLPDVAHAHSMKVNYEHVCVLHAFTLRLTLPERIFMVLETPSLSSWAGRLLTIVVVMAIITSSFVMLLSSHPNHQVISEECYEIHKTTTEPCASSDAHCMASCEPLSEGILPYLESICCVIFTIEVFLRLALVHRIRMDFLDDDFIAGLIGRAAMDANETLELAGPFSINAVQQHEQVFVENVGKLHVTNHCRRTLKYLLSPSVLADTLSVGPFWLDYCGLMSPSSPLSGLFVLRILRLLRVFRIFRLGKNGQMLAMMSRVARRSQVTLRVFAFIVVIICLVFGSMVWVSEKGQWLPQGHPVLLDLGITKRSAYVRSESLLWWEPSWAESPFRSVAHASWWVIITITCVGYGDMFPTGDLGKFCGCLTALIGVTFLAMPLGVIGSNFTTEFNIVMQQRKKRELALQAARKRKLKFVRQASKTFKENARQSRDLGRNSVSVPKELAPEPATPNSLQPAPEPSPQGQTPLPPPSQPAPRTEVRRPATIPGVEAPVSALPALNALEDWWLSALKLSGNDVAARSHWLPLRKRKKAVDNLKGFTELRETDAGEPKKGSSSIVNTQQSEQNIAKLSGKLQLWVADELSFGVGSQKETDGISSAEHETQKLITTLEGAAGLASAFRSALIQIKSMDRRGQRRRRVDPKPVVDEGYARPESQLSAAPPNAPPPSRAGGIVAPMGLTSPLQTLVYEQYDWDDAYEEVPAYHDPYEIVHEPESWDDTYDCPEHLEHPDGARGAWRQEASPPPHSWYHHNDMGHLPGLWPRYGPYDGPGPYEEPSGYLPEQDGYEPEEYLHEQDRREIIDAPPGHPGRAWYHPYP